jgi:ABC-type multidrug transport system, ATPase component
MRNLSIEIVNLNKRFNENFALKNINLQIFEGEILGLLGPNGSGKSTLLKLILGMIKPDSGRITVYGYDSVKDSLKIRKISGYVPEDVRLYEFLTGIEYLEFICKIYEIDNTNLIYDYLKIFEIYDKKDEMIASYSLGMKRKIAIIAALIHKPKLLLLDEPLNGLDPKSARIFKDIILNLKKTSTIIFSTHILEIAQAICDKIAILDKGQLINMVSINEILEISKNKSLEEYFLKITGGDEIKNLVEVLLK